MRKRRRQLTVRVGLSQQSVSLGLEGLDSVSAGRKAGRRLLECSKLHKGFSQFGGIAPLFAIHATPCRNGLSGTLGIVVDRRRSESSGAIGEQLGTEETRLD